MGYFDQQVIGLTIIDKAQEAVARTSLQHLAVNGGHSSESLLYHCPVRGGNER